jgi:hypothetical protein
MSKADNAAVLPKLRQTEPPHVPTPGTVLVALTSTVVCWLLTGIIGFVSPSLPVHDDMTITAVILWMPQVIATIYLVWIAVTRGWSTPAAISSAAIVGFSAALMYGVCRAQWGNAATYVFWITTGIYVALGLEAKFAVAEAVERKIGMLLDL